MRCLSLVLSAAVLAGCGGAATPQENASPAVVIDRAAAKMLDAGSARYTVEGTMRNRHYAQRPLPFGVKGITRFDGKRAWIWWDLSNIAPELASAQLPPGQRETLKHLLEDAHAWRMELRLRGKTSWMRIPAFADIPGAKPWIRYDERPERRRSRDELSSDAASFSWVDPAAMIPYLRASRQMEKVGKKDGLTHYRGRVQLRRLPALVPKSERRQVRYAVRLIMRQTRKAALPFEVWVAEDGLPRRFEITDVEPRERGERYPTTWKATVEILEYGVDFDVLRPPARKVMSEAQFDGLHGS